MNWIVQNELDRAMRAAAFAIIIAACPGLAMAQQKPEPLVCLTPQMATAMQAAALDAEAAHKAGFAELIRAIGLTKELEDVKKQFLDLQATQK